MQPARNPNAQYGAMSRMMGLRRGMPFNNSHAQYLGTGWRPGHGPQHQGPPPNFPGMGQQGGYQGLDNIFSMLTNGGVNQSQFDKMNAGYTGANGAIGGMHGAFQGLSPYAMHFLASSGLLEKQQGQMQDLTGLTGNDLFKAQLQNTLTGAQPASYKLHGGVTQEDLQHYLEQTQGGGYAKGYDAEGKKGNAYGHDMQQFIPPGHRGEPNRRQEVKRQHALATAHDLHEGRPLRRRGRGRRAFIGEPR